MHIYKLQCEMIAPVGIDEAFSVFKDPYNLAAITPPWLNFKILTPNVEMRKGAEIEYGFRWLGLPLHWKTVITEYEAPFFFVDEALKSPYALWRHRHTFRPSLQGTIVGDSVEYALPLGVAGRIIHAIAVNGQIRRIFQFRQDALAKLMGARLIHAQEPVIVTVAK